MYKIYHDIPDIPWYICCTCYTMIYQYIMLYTFDICWFESKELPLTSKPSLNASLYNLPVTKGVFIIILMSHGTTVTWGKKKVPFGSEKHMASFVSKTQRLTSWEFFRNFGVLLCGKGDGKFKSMTLMQCGWPSMFCSGDLKWPVFMDDLHEFLCFE